ncbi:MAG: sigma-70 family RNA polymerase sigma factor [Planctomycetes bacterium]|nr:sigma-70 family RNA polymerase sigma factor [Planctomycetota bacterium]
MAREDVTLDHEITALLQRWRGGDRAALESVAPLIYRELRRIAGWRLAAGRIDESLRPTGLVHEAWIRIAGSAGAFDNRRHFFAHAALAMRSVLVDRARRVHARRHGGDARDVALATGDGASRDPRDELLDGIALGEALDRLHVVAPDASAVATLRFLCGHSVDETADLLGVSAGKVKKDWAFARAFLRRELSRGAHE